MTRSVPQPGNVYRLIGKDDETSIAKGDALEECVVEPMYKWRVVVTRDVTESVQLTVEAPDQASAISRAIDVAHDGADGKEWALDLGSCGERCAHATEAKPMRRVN